MKLLVDESLPIALAATPELAVHEVSTVRAQRWLGLRNGVLLRAAVAAGFEVLITGVRNRMSDLHPLLPRIAAALQDVRKGQLIEISRSRL